MMARSPPGTTAAAAVRAWAGGAATGSAPSRGGAGPRGGVRGPPGGGRAGASSGAWRGGRASPGGRGRAPPILMLDEPATGLDPEGIVWIRGLLRALAARGRAVLVSSHLMTGLQDTADRLLII